MDWKEGLAWLTIWVVAGFVTEIAVHRYRLVNSISEKPSEETNQYLLV